LAAAVTGFTAVRVGLLQWYYNFPGLSPGLFYAAQQCLVNFKQPVPAESCIVNYKCPAR
jgi:hypothetical protein